MDSGACVSIISLDILTVLDKNFHYDKLKPSQKIMGVTGKKIKTHGVYDLQIEIQNKNFNIPITVIDRPGVFLLGRDFMIHARASLIYNTLYNGFELKLNHKSHLSKIHLIQESTIKPFQNLVCSRAQVRQPCRTRPPPLFRC